jgi:hypothetical protein
VALEEGMGIVHGMIKVESWWTGPHHQRGFLSFLTVKTQDPRAYATALMTLITGGVEQSSCCSIQAVLGRKN